MQPPGMATAGDGEEGTATATVAQDEEHEKNGPRDVVDISWTAGKFFLFFTSFFCY
jgi:hypothetical protein